MIKNPLIKRILIALFCIIAILTAIYFAVKIIKNDRSDLIYDLGERTSGNNYSDFIITSYNEYQNIIEEYNIKEFLIESSFDNNYYLASFQDYNSCNEKKPKTVDNVILNEGKITVTYKIYNKCGWCKNHDYLYLIAIPKVEDISEDIEYKYTYENDTLKCGTVS